MGWRNLIMKNGVTPQQKRNAIPTPNQSEVNQALAPAPFNCHQVNCNPQRINISSQVRLPFSSGSNVWVNLETIALNRLISMVMPNGISISHTDEKANKKLQIALRNVDINAIFSLCFRLTAEKGYSMMLITYNEEDNAVEMYMNDVLNISDLRKVGNKIVEITGTFNLSTINSEGTKINIDYRNNKLTLWGQGIESTKKNYQFEKNDVLPVFDFNYLPYKTFVDGRILSGFSFNHACKNLQCAYDDAWDTLERECMMNISRLQIAGVNERDTYLNKKLGESNIITKPAVTTMPGNYKTVGPDVSPLDPAQTNFVDRLAYLNTIKHDYMLACGIPDVDQTYNLGKTTNEASALTLQSAINQMEWVKQHWAQQGRKWVEWICRFIGLEYEKDGRSLVNFRINKSLVGRTEKDIETMTYMVEHGLASLPETIADLYNISLEEAIIKIEKEIIPSQKKYRDTTFYGEKAIADLNPKDKEGHPEDIGDKSKIKKATKDKE